MPDACVHRIVRWRGIKCIEPNVCDKLKSRARRQSTFVSTSLYIPDRAGGVKGVDTHTHTHPRTLMYGPRCLGVICDAQCSVSLCITQLRTRLRQHLNANAGADKTRRQNRLAMRILFSRQHMPGCRFELLISRILAGGGGGGGCGGANKSAVLPKWMLLTQAGGMSDRIVCARQRRMNSNVADEKRIQLRCSPSFGWGLINCTATANSVRIISHPPIDST